MKHETFKFLQKIDTSKRKKSIPKFLKVGVQGEKTLRGSPGISGVWRH
jgi:hypothetical protein